MVVKKKIVSKKKIKKINAAFSRNKLEQSITSIKKSVGTFLSIFFFFFLLTLFYCRIISAQLYGEEELVLRNVFQSNYPCDPSDGLRTARLRHDASCSHNKNARMHKSAWYQMHKRAASRSPMRYRGPAANNRRHKNIM